MHCFVQPLASPLRAMLYSTGLKGPEKDRMVEEGEQKHGLFFWERCFQETSTHRSTRALIRLALSSDV